jgi:hypothetical protein
MEKKIIIPELDLIERPLKMLIDAHRMYGSEIPTQVKIYLAGKEQIIKFTLK